MGKIKGWRKIEDTNTRERWYSEKGGYDVQVKEQDGSYLATPGRSDRARRFSTKIAAKQWILDYMRRHPNG